MEILGLDLRIVTITISPFSLCLLDTHLLNSSGEETCGHVDDDMSDFV